MEASDSPAFDNVKTAREVVKVLDLLMTRLFPTLSGGTISICVQYRTVRRFKSAPSLFNNP